MAHQLDIINLALSRVNARRIPSTSERSKEARAAALAWDTALDATLRAHPWGFASRRSKLAALPETPPGHGFAYLEPAGCVAVRKVLPTCTPGRDEPSALFTLGNDGDRTVILTDVPDAWAEYTARIDNCTLFDPQFADALVWRLAGEFAAALKSDYEAMASMLRMAETMAKQATVADAEEHVFKDDPISSFERARWGCHAED